MLKRLLTVNDLQAGSPYRKVIREALLTEVNRTKRAVTERIKAEWPDTTRSAPNSSAS